MYAGTYTYKGKLIGMPLYAVTILPEDPSPMVAVMVLKKRHKDSGVPEICR